jgi:uncharacterized membrane protein YbaN (DUF454 family)
MTSHAPPRSRLRRAAILIAGWAMVLLGIVGLFLPILQGVLFLAVGFYLLSLESPWAKRRMEWFQRRYPKFHDTLEQGRLRAARMARRIRRRIRR